MLLDRVPSITGVDRSPRAIRFARAFHPDIDFRVGDASSLSDQFDLVTAIEVLEHVPNDELPAFIRALRDRCRPGGYLIVSVPSALMPVQSKHFRHYRSEKPTTELQSL